jgi:hypothetical protein
VRLAEHHQMVEAFAPSRANEPLDVSVLPGRACRNWMIADAHSTHAASVCRPFRSSKLLLHRYCFVPVNKARLLKRTHNVGAHPQKGICSPWNNHFATFRPSMQIVPAMIGSLTRFGQPGTEVAPIDLDTEIERREERTNRLRPRRDEGFRKA